MPGLLRERRLCQKKCGAGSPAVFYGRGLHLREKPVREAKIAASDACDWGNGLRVGKIRCRD
jgi:hypothetical protein